jgi:hypothetical protein
MNKPNFYAIIPANVRYDTDLTPSAKLLYGEISALSNAQGFCWATNAYFAELYNMSARNVSRLISSLADKGFIRIELINDFERKIYINVPQDNSAKALGQKSRGGQAEKVMGSQAISVPAPQDKNGYKNNTIINITDINNINNTKTNKVTNKQISDEFAFLWKLYPNKKGKPKALEHYEKARKKGLCTFDEVKNGIESYVKYIDVHGLDVTKIKHGSTYFNQHCWTDEYGNQDFQKKKEYSKFTQLMLNEMDNPDQFLFEIGVETDEQKRNCKIIYDDKGQLSERIQGH